MGREGAGKDASGYRGEYNGGGRKSMLLEKRNIRVDEIGKKYVEPPIREIKPEPSRDRFRSEIKRQKGKKRQKFGRR